MWRPLRPRVKRELRRLQSGETSGIVVTSKWEYDEVDRRMRRFDAKLQLSESFEESDDYELAEVILLSPRPEFTLEAQRQLKAVGSDVDPSELQSVQSRLGRPLVGMRVPNALDNLPKANQRVEIPEVEAEADIAQLAELLEFVLWVVSELDVVDTADLVQYICYQFEIGTYTDREIGAVLEVILTEPKERSSD